MSELPPGVSCRYNYVKVRILACNNPNFWYANKVGQVVEAQKRTYIENGKITGVSYWASPKGEKNDWRGGLPLEVEEVL